MIEQLYSPIWTRELILSRMKRFLDTESGTKINFIPCEKFDENMNKEIIYKEVSDDQKIEADQYVPIEEVQSILTAMVNNGATHVVLIEDDVDIYFLGFKAENINQTKLDLNESND